MTKLNQKRNGYDDYYINNPNKKMIYFKALWLSQPLCLGLTRLSGGLLFGSMILLGCAAIGGLIASIVLYNQGKKK